jgi:NitT/TauT family transport system permease protein
MAWAEPMPAAAPLDAEEAQRIARARREKIGRWVLPILIMTAAILFWDRVCVWNGIPRYILPRPS